MNLHGSFQGVTKGSYELGSHSQPMQHQACYGHPEDSGRILYEYINVPFNILKLVSKPAYDHVDASKYKCFLYVLQDLNLVQMRHSEPQ